VAPADALKLLVDFCSISFALITIASLLHITGKEEVVTVDQASVIIGAGALGSALASLGLGDDVILRRGDSIPVEIENNKGEKLTSFPIYVAVSFTAHSLYACT
jgi:hypothetical protein